MIFVTVGAQLPFDRLVACVDNWARLQQRSDIFAQIGQGGQRPLHCAWSEFLTPDEFRERIMSASLVVGHAGMGTILSCLQFAKPLIVMPRRQYLRETRNDHQVASATRFANVRGVTVAMDEQELMCALLHAKGIEVGGPIGPVADVSLLNALRAFIRQDTPADSPAESLQIPVELT